MHYGFNAFSMVAGEKTDSYLLTSIIQSSEDAIYFRSADGYIKTWNPGGFRVFGYTDEEVIGKHVSIFVPPELQEETEWLLEKTEKGEPVYNFETIRLNKIGQRINVSLSIFPVINDHNELLGITVVARNITDRVQIENALRDSEAKYKRMVEEAGDIVYTSDYKGYFTYINQAFKKFSGFEPEAYIGKHFTEVIHPDWKNKVAAFYKEQFEKRIEETTFSFPIIILDDEVKWVEQTVKLQEDNQRVAGFQSILRDVTERVKSASEIELLKMNLTNAIENIDGYIWSIDTNHRILICNTGIKKHFFQYYGTLLEPGIHVDEALPPDKFPEENKYWTHLYSTALGGEKYYDQRSYNTEGETHTFSIFINPIRNEKNEIVGAAGVALNITDRIKMEEKLKASEHFLHSAFEMIPQMIFIKEAIDLKFIEVNKAGENLLGMRKEELIGKSDYDFFPKEQADFFVQADRDVLGSGTIVHISEEPITTKHQGTRYLQTTKTCIQNDKGEPAYLLGISVDITERKLMEEKQAELLKNLEKMNKELSNFAYIVSHDLKAPLRAMGAISHWLYNDYSDKINKEGKDQLNMLVGRVKRLDNQIEGILRYSKIGNTIENKTQVDLNLLIQELAKYLLTPDSNLEIKIENKLPVLHIDQGLIEQVFHHLIENAIKYMDKPNGVILIGSKEEKSHYEFYVSDNGPGIDPRYYDKIFLLFQTLTPKDKKESTGIGLAIVKKIIEAKGGKIWIESEPGKKCCFYFTLPKSEVLEPSPNHHYN